MCEKRRKKSQCASQIIVDGVAIGSGAHSANGRDSGCWEEQENKTVVVLALF